MRTLLNKLLITFLIGSHIFKCVYFVRKRIPLSTPKARLCTLMPCSSMHEIMKFFGCRLNITFEKDTARLFKIQIHPKFL